MQLRYLRYYKDNTTANDVMSDPYNTSFAEKQNKI